VRRPITADELLAILEQAPALLGLESPDLTVPPTQILIDAEARARGETALELVGCDGCGVGSGTTELPGPVRPELRRLKIAGEPVDAYVGTCRNCGRLFWG
jgi:hypothetical protein